MCEAVSKAGSLLAFVGIVIKRISIKHVAGNNTCKGKRVRK